MRGKRDIRHGSVDAVIVRKANGALHDASEGTDIRDVWAGLERAQLKNAIHQDQKKRARKERLRTAFGGTKAATPKASHDEVKTIEIKLSVPGMSGASVRTAMKRMLSFLRPVYTGKGKWIVASAAVLTVVAVGGVMLYRHTSAKEGQVKVRTVNGQPVSGSAEVPPVPEYDTLLPEGKTIEQLGGWGRVSPPDKDPVYAFRDQISNVEISVSQQPLPKDFVQNTDSSVAKLAERFSANEKIRVKDNTAYVGTSAEGPQSVIFVRKDTLLLIKSAAKISNSQWEAYLLTLR